MIVSIALIPDSMSDLRLERGMVVSGENSTFEVDKEATCVRSGLIWENEIPVKNPGDKVKNVWFKFKVHKGKKGQPPITLIKPVLIQSFF